MTRQPSASVLALPRIYFELAKGRLTAMIALTAAAGFVVARPEAVDWGRLGWTAVGTFLCAASANGLNQILEARFDALVQRTARRPLPSGRIARGHAILWSATLGVAGITLLVSRVNPAVAALGAGNIILYAAIYTPLKTRSPLATLVGALVGAVPPVMGWLAASGRLEPGAGLLAALLFVWQVPHALTVAWRCRAESALAGYRSLPALDPTGILTARMALLYASALVPLGLVATLTGLAGPLYGCAALALGLLLCWRGVSLWRRLSEGNARRLYATSLLYLPALLLLMAFDHGPPESLARPPVHTAAVHETPSLLP